LVSGFNINVDSYRGTVQLRGDVPTMQEMRRALEIARSVGGVQEVVNKITVSRENS
jgi:osmotically-inducible protein OsmY